MRFIHTSDWHLGRSLHGEPLLDAQARFLDWLLQQAIERTVDAVVVAGDIYDRAIPQLDAVALLNRTLTGFARAGIPILLTSGNHDSAVRLGFGSELSESAGVHLRTAVADLDRPVVVHDATAPVAFYGLPYLLPDAVADELGAAERSHRGVLTAAMDRVRADAQSRGIHRVVVAAHAFVTGGAPSESERDIRIGGIGDAPVTVFDGVQYAALGHLHEPQRVSAPGAATTVRYSGSPLAFSFSERHHAKSVAVVELDADGAVTTELVAVPSDRRLREVRGPLDELLAQAAEEKRAGDACAEDWIKAVITDAVRPAAPMERLRRYWPRTIVLEFAPLVRPGSSEVSSLTRPADDPVEICSSFVEYVAGTTVSDNQRQLLRDAVEAAQQEDVA